MSSPSPALKTIVQPRLPQPVESTPKSPLPCDDADMLDTLAVVVEHTPVAIAMFDRQMRYVLANRQWVREFNLSQALPLVGRSQYEVFPKLHPGWRQLYERALQGYTMRSDHPLHAAAGGPPMLFRCEVRPWRQKRDASVAGVVVTCTKFTGSANAGPLPESAALGDLDLSAMELPLFVLDSAGRILSANRRAAELSLARGLDEGATNLWEVLADEAGRQGLKQTFEELTGRLQQSPETPPQIITLKSNTPPPAGSGHGDEGKAGVLPCRWMLARHGEGPGRWVLVGLTGLSPFEAVTKVGIQLPTPAPVRELTVGNGLAKPSAAAEEEKRRAELLAKTRTDLEKALAGHDQTRADLAAAREDLARLQRELRALRDAEQTLARREARRQSVLEALPGGILVLDEQGRALLQNARLRNLFGQAIEPGGTVEEWLGLACPDKEHRTEVRRVWREDVWRRQLTRTFSLVTRDGLLKEIELRPASLAGDGLLVYFQDVTGQCRMEEQLNAMESKFRALFQDNPLPVVIADKTGAVYDANRAALDLFQRPRAELRRLPVDALLVPESAAARKDALRELRQSGGTHQRLTVHLAGEDAPKMRLTLAGIPTANGEFHGTLHFFETPLSWPSPVPAPADVEREKTPEAPAEAVARPPEAGSAESIEPQQQAEPQQQGEALCKRLTGEPPVPLLATGANGRVKHWTEAAAELFGHSEAEALGLPLHLLFQPSDPSGFYGAALPVAARAGRAEWAFFGRDGRRGTLACEVRTGEQGGFPVELWICSK